MKLSAINMAFEYLKSKNDSAAFEEIGNACVKNLDAQNQEHQDAMKASLYCDLVIDPRFSLTPDGTGGLRDNMRYEDVKRRYDFLDTLVVKKNRNHSDDTEDSYQSYDTTQDSTAVVHSSPLEAVVPDFTASETVAEDVDLDEDDDDDYLEELEDIDDFDDMGDGDEE